MVDTGISKILISEEEIKTLVDSLGKEITAHYTDAGGELVVVGLLRGAFVFMSDLVRKIDYPLVVDFLAVSSYGDGTVSSGDVRIMMDLDGAVEGKHVLLVEDVVDTGTTFSKVIKMLKKRSPKSLKVCTLLNKPARRKVDVHIDFCGIDIPDEFVCGYGLDYAQKYRNLPYIGVLEIGG
ncbi:MAG: hypoxanthine phosphoribosyltransferase [Desulfobacterales bacterium]|nr:MAG: hypoxanthine phosphoribosyltransferase [Desulfobacterales bacterium]